MQRYSIEILIFSILASIGISCSPTNQSARFTPPSNFDKSVYINPDNYVKGLLYNADNYNHVVVDSSFTLASLNNERKTQQVVNYPAAARRKGIQGTVILKIYVDSTGTLRNLETVQSPHKLLSEASIEAAAKVRYNPAKLKGEPVNSFFYSPFMFQMATRNLSTN